MNFSGLKECAILESKAVKIIDSVNHRSEILIYGLDITLRLQLFYDTEVYKKLLAHIYDDVTVKRIIDFHCEVCNLVGGKIKEALMDQSIVVALSLPMNIETTKIKAINSHDVLKEFGFFDIEFGGQKILSSKISFQIHNEEKLKNFKVSEVTDSSNDGDVEFL